MSILKVGIIVPDLSPSQLTFNLINSFNQFCQKNGRLVDLIVFIKNVTPPCIATQNVTLMNISEIFDYDGTLITTDINSAVQSINLPGPKRKIFYSYDLDWLRRDRNYQQLQPIYNHPALELWARSEDHKRLIELTFNCKVKNVLEECKIDQIYELLRT